MTMDLQGGVYHVERYPNIPVTQESMQKPTLKASAFPASIVTKHSGQDLTLEIIFVDFVRKNNIQYISFRSRGSLRDHNKKLKCQRKGNNQM